MQCLGVGGRQDIVKARHSLGHVGAIFHDAVENHVSGGIHPPQIGQDAVAEHMAARAIAIVEHLPGGNLGGIIGIPIVGYLSERHDWNTAFLLGAGLALVSAMAWLGIRSAAPPALRSTGIIPEASR